MRSIYFDVWHKDDDEPAYFEAEYNFFFDTAYDSLVEMTQQEFGEPDEEKETKNGTISKWHIDDTKTISVVPDKWGTSFTIKYMLE